MNYIRLFPGFDFSKEFWGNSIAEYLDALLIFIGLALLFFVIQKVVIWRLKKLAEKTKTEIDDALIAMVRSIKPPFYYFISFFVAVQFIELLGLASKILGIILVVWAVYQVVSSLQILLNFLLDKKMEKVDTAEGKFAYRFVGRIVKWILWILGLLFILSNLGVNVTSLVAGLGIGGLAVAFALQNILGDLFGAFVIFFDKPFTTGDFIETGAHLGTVEKVGIKTTRLRGLDGPEIIISNNELTSSRVTNYGRLEERRAVLNFGVLYETPAEKIERIPEIIEGIVKENKKNVFDRAHFKSLGESSLDFEVVFYVKTTDYNEYMNAREQVNLGIMKSLQEEGIGFAYPTRTVYMANEGE